MDSNLVELHDAYLHGQLERRQFMHRLAILAGGTLAASTLLPLLEYNYAQAALVPEDDPRLETAQINYNAPKVYMKAYWARPRNADRVPAVLVVHENRGLNPHIEDVTRRIALEGFAAMAPDALSATGGTPGVEKEAIAQIRKLDKKTTLDNFLAAAQYLQTKPQTSGKVGVVGFCWGGAMANQLAVHSPAIDAAVPYYGRQPKSEDVSKIKASLLLHYAGIDQRINQGIPGFEAALNKAGVEYKLYMYEGAMHAFNNDTNQARYNPEAAKLAWGRTIAFLKQKLE